MRFLIVATLAIAMLIGSFEAGRQYAKSAPVEDHTAELLQERLQLQACKEESNRRLEWTKLQDQQFRKAWEERENGIARQVTQLGAIYHKAAPSASR